MIGSEVRRDRVRAADDDGSLALAMLLIVVGAALSALLLPVALVQVDSTRVNIRRVHALDAAQAGLDVALGHIRDAQSSGAGSVKALPCSLPDGTAGVGGTARYHVSIDYFTADPRGHFDDSVWLSGPAHLTCGGNGTFPKTPAFALLSSAGTDQPTGTFSQVAKRTLRATYTFWTTNLNIPGGAIQVYKTGVGPERCMDAGSSAPVVGAPLYIRTCDDALDSQRFAYNGNLNIALVASKSSANPLGMCLDAGKPHSSGTYVKFALCDPTLPQQAWSLNSNNNFEGTDGTALDGYCFNVETPTSSSNKVVLRNGSSCYQTYDSIETFQPTATVGAGAAGTATDQLVNFRQLGRCMDFTGGDPINFKFLIAWPCKQAPDPADVGWNQKWMLQAIPDGSFRVTGRITITKPSPADPPSGAAGLYCMQSPGSTAAGAYVKAALCTGTASSPPPSMKWTVYGDTGVFETSYRIVDTYGYCLAPTDPDAPVPDMYMASPEISKIHVVVCSGSSLLKWNAPPDILESLPLKDLNEK